MGVKKEDVRVVCYAYGNIVEGNDGVHYDQWPVTIVTVSRDATYEQLMSTICSRLKINRTTHMIELLHRFSIGDVSVYYEVVPIKDDYDARQMLGFTQDLVSVYVEIYEKELAAANDIDLAWDTRLASSLSSSASSRNRSSGRLIEGIITRCFSALTYPSQPLKLRDNASQGGQRKIKYRLSSTTTLIIQKGDITTWSIDLCTDAIVNSANVLMLGGGGADGAIHRVAGPELLEACYKVPEVYPGIRCPTGEARITPGFRLPASRVIHTVGPIYYFDSNLQASLANAYRNSLYMAKQNNIQYIAFPAISCGVNEFPFDEAATIAVSTIKKFSDGLKEVHVVLFFDEIYNAWTNEAKKLLKKQRFSL